mgnify:CR=1 FL=1
MGLGSEGADVRVAKVITEDDNNVWLPFGGQGRGQGRQQGGERAEDLFLPLGEFFASPRKSADARGSPRAQSVP